MTKNLDEVWVGYETEFGDGHSQGFTTPPQIVFTNENSAKKWKKLDHSRELQKFTPVDNAKCDTCGSVLK